MAENPDLWHYEKYGTRDRASQAWRMLILEALHNLGGRGTFLDIAGWIIQTQPWTLREMRSYVYTWGLDAARNDQHKLSCWQRYYGSDGWPEHGTWQEQFDYTVYERVQWYCEIMRRNRQLTTDPDEPESAYISSNLSRLAAKFGGTRQGIKVYKWDPDTCQPLVVDRFKPRKASKTYRYDPRTPDWWAVRDQARADLREMRARAKPGSERRRQLDAIYLLIHQIEHFYDEPQPAREDDT